MITTGKRRGGQVPGRRGQELDILKEEQTGVRLNVQVEGRITDQVSQLGDWVGIGNLPRLEVETDEKAGLWVEDIFGLRHAECEMQVVR